MNIYKFFISPLDKYKNIYQDIYIFGYKYITSLYFLDLMFEVFLIKVLIYYFKNNNYVYTSFVFGSFLPFFISKIISNKKLLEFESPTWNNLFNGFLDFVNLISISTNFKNYTFSNYIPLTTLCTLIISMTFYNHKKHTCSNNSIFLKYFGIFCIFIGLSFLIVLSFINYLNIIIFLFGGVFYWSNNYFIERYIKIDMNYLWSKTISGILNLSVPLIYSSKIEIYSVSYFLVIILLLSIAENFYYLITVNIIKQSNNNNIVINYIDLTKRFSSLIISMILNSDNYNNIIYVICFILLGNYFTIKKEEIIDDKEIEIIIHSNP